MSSLSPGKVDLEQVPVSGAILIAVLGTTLIQIYMILIAPGLFTTLPFYTVTGLLCIAFISALYNIFAARLGLPHLLQTIIFLLVQWIFLFGRICLGTKSTTFFFNPFIIDGNSKAWVVTSILIWITVSFLSHLLSQLSRIPQTADLIEWKKKAWGESDTEVDSLKRESIWQQWRFGIATSMVLTVFGYITGYWVNPEIFVRNGWLANYAEVLLYGQLLFGFTLIAVGFYVYKRAEWKTKRLTPDLCLISVWRHWASLIMGVVFLSCIRAPILTRKSHHFTAGEPTRLLKPVPSSIPEPDLMTPPKWVNFGPGSMNVPRDVDLHKILVLIGLFLAVLLIGYLLTKVIIRDFDLVKGLRMNLVRFYIYLVRRWQKFWCWGGAKLQAIINEGWTSPKNLDAGKASFKPKAHLWGYGPKAIIRREYYRLIEAARLKGMSWHRTRTPEEIAAELSTIVTDCDDSITEITAGYQLARYGLGDPPTTKVKLFERLRKEVQQQLNKIKKKAETPSPRAT